MRNKLLAQMRRYEMVQPGDTVICAVSGGADSMALLFCLYLLQKKLQITLEAAHFNHGLRAQQSDRDEAFVRAFCRDYEIPLHCARENVKPGKKGLEAAAREARYAFFSTLSGKVATAHTADDNAETVLMHLVRGTALKGLGGISPVRANVIRPMLTVTRREVLAFLKEYSIAWVEDSTNEEDVFLRNRLRHRVMPLLQQENPKIVQNLSQMAMQLREDEAALSQKEQNLPGVDALRKMDASSRNRALAVFLVRCGVKEPERTHIALARELVFSDKPSARASFPGGVVICREYDALIKLEQEHELELQELTVPGVTKLPGYTVVCSYCDRQEAQTNAFTVAPKGKLVARKRRSTDRITLSGGSKTLKKLFIDKKIPALRRLQIPVLADDAGVLGVCGIGANQDRLAPGVKIEIIPNGESEGV